MEAPVPPKGLTKEVIEKEFGPLPKCKHGTIHALCQICNYEYYSGGRDYAEDYDSAIDWDLHYGGR